MKERKELLTADLAKHQVLRLLRPLPGHLRPHCTLAAPVRDSGDRPNVLLADEVVAQPVVNPKWTLCLSQFMGKVRISRASERPDGSSPLRIASMISGASVVSFRMRTT